MDVYFLTAKLLLEGYFPELYTVDWVSTEMNKQD